MIVGGTVLADTPQDLNGGNLQLLRSYSVGVNGGVHISAASPGSTYSNVTNFTGFDYANGGAGPDPANAANTITTLVADDIHMLGPATITQFTFSVSNDSADQDTSARPRVRFYQTNGAGGGPGTNITGFSFNPIAFTHNSIGLFTGTIAPLVLPKDFWVGITFDNNAGATGALDSDLNLLGQGIFDPPNVGTSQDRAFQTTGPGSFLSNNPPGTTFDFGHSSNASNPVANFGWEFVGTLLPEPASMSVLALGGLMALRRRRSC